MAEQHSHTISLGELEKAVTAAVQQLDHQKIHGAHDIGKSRLIIGRWVQTHIPQAEAHAAAQEITKQVPGLKQILLPPASLAARLWALFSASSRRAHTSPRFPFDVPECAAGHG